MGFSNVLCFALILAVSTGAPTSVTKDCKGTNAENLLEKQTNYKYSYHAIATAKSVGTTDLENKIDVKCDVHLQHGSHCLFNMEVKNCHLKAYEVNGQGQTVDEYVTGHTLDALTEHPIAFTLSDGEIKSVFVSDSDPLFSVNMKRGIASAFVNRKSDLSVTGPTEKIQVDVQGTCPVVISPLQSGKVQAKKDLDGCYLPSRKDYHLSPLAMFFNMSFIQHVINSTEDCKITGNEGLTAIQSVHCHERHAIMLESTHHTAAAVQTVIDYKMELQESGKKKGSPLDISDKKEVGIIFEYEENSNSYHYEPEYLAQRVKNLLTEIIKLASNEIHVDTIRQHRDLVGLLRSSQESLSQLTEAAISCDYYPGCTDSQKKIIRDIYEYALLQCNTVPCLDSLADMVEKKLVSRPSINFAYLALSNIHHIPKEYIGSVLRMCLSTTDRFCYGTLGALINKYNNENKLDENNVLPKEITDTVQHLSATLGTECSLKNGKFPSSLTNDKKLDYMTTVIKTIGNMGSVYKMADGAIVGHLTRCARNPELSPAAAVSAIESYRKMPATEDIGTALLDILNDENSPVEQRLAAYDVLTSNFNVEMYRDSFLTLLMKKQTKSQVREFLAVELRRARKEYHLIEAKKDTEDARRSKRSLDPVISIYDDLATFDLDSVPVNEISSSMKEVEEESIELDFLPEGFNVFGARVEVETIFNALSAFPQGVKANLTTELFGHIFQLVEVGLQTGGWENIISQIQTMILTLKEPNIVQYGALIMQTLAQNRATAKRRPTNAFELKSKVLLDEAIEESIKRLRKDHKESQEIQYPYLMASLRMLGNDLGFLSYEDIIGEVQKAYASFAASIKDRDIKREYSGQQARVLDFIEAYHQFPTLMGLSLNWTTNASFAYSVKGGISVNGQAALATANLHHSAAVTFLNRMVLDLPTVTNIGVQANSSAYNDLEFGINLSLTRGSVARVSINVPDKVQRPLELFRTNQIIKGGRYVNIEDHDIKRITEKKCSPKLVEDLTGSRVCVEKSYADVRDQIKPWFPMAGSAHMTVHVTKVDPEMASVNADISIEQPSKTSERKVDLTLSAPGANGVQRNVPILTKFNVDTNEFALSVAHSEYPEFHFNVERVKTADAPSNNGYKSTMKASVQKGKEYEIIYNKHHKEEEREDVPEKRNKSPKVEKFVSKIDERQLKFTTPYNHYKYHSQLHRNLDNDKLDVHLSYENKDPSLNLVPKILPKVFFENDRKASIRILSNYRHPHKRGKDGLSRSATTHITIPYSTIEIKTHTVEESDRKKIKINVTKVETSTGHTLAFFNVTCNYIKKVSPELQREVGELDVSIPYRHYTAKLIMEDHRKGQEFLQSLELLRIKTPFKSSGEVDPSPLRFVYEQRIKHREGSDDDLTETVKKAMNNEFEAVPGAGGVYTTKHNSVVNADIRFTYPFGGKQEHVDLNGTLKYIVTGTPGAYTFGKDFVLSSSLHHLSLHSTSGVVRLDQNRYSLLHHSYFTNTATGTNQGKYNLKIQSAWNPQRCPFFKMNHNIDAHFLQFSSNIDMICKESAPRKIDLTIDIDNHSPYLKELDLKLRQKFLLSREGFESMNMTSNIADITVTGDWSDKENRYNKRVKIDSKIEKVPSYLVEMNGELRGEMTLTAQPIGGELALKKLIIRRNVKFDHGTVIYYKVSHIEKDSDVEAKDLSVRVQIRNPQEVIVTGNGNANSKLYTIYGKYLCNRVKQLGEYVKDKISDPENELNQNLSPYFGMTVKQYGEHLSDEANKKGVELMEQLAEVADGLSDFYGPSLEVLINIASELHELSDVALGKFKKTTLGFLVYYFEIPQTIENLLDNEDEVDESVDEILKELLLGYVEKDGDFEFSFAIHPLILKRIMNAPELGEKTVKASYPLLARITAFILDETRIQRAPLTRVDEKIAMIFGNNGVLTFDGTLYRTPKYPHKDCAFLLAHDVRGKSFSLLTTKTKIHAIFPEMAVSVDERGNVYANATPSDSSNSLNLPLVSSNSRVSVYREDEETVTVRSPFLRLRCNIKSFQCIILMSALQHHGTMGLLGNADREIDNEFLSSKNQPLNSPTELATHYELSGKPECKNISPPPVPMYHPSVKTTCDNRLSEVKANQCQILARLDKHELTESCYEDLATSSPNQKEECATVDALASLCSYYNVRGEGCERCEGEIKVGETTNKQAEAQVDLVLIVEENSLVLNGGKSAALKGVETLVGDIESLFQGEGYSNFNINVVGFGGKDGAERYPHIQTMGIELNYKLAELGNVLKTLKFDGESKSDIISAVEYANDALDFRPTASRIFILIANSDVESPNHIQLQRLRILQNQLNHNGVTLYSFAPFPTIAKGKKVFGLRADGLIFPNSGKSYMDYPKSLIAKITSATRGSIFLSSFVVENQNQAFFYGVSEEVMAKVGKEKNKCKKCKCERNFLYNLRSKCHPSEC